MKPFLRYFEKCTFPREKGGNYFHILGIDIILDDQCNPWILEVNANPSLNVESSTAKAQTGDTISPIDLHVKSM